MHVVNIVKMAATTHHLVSGPYIDCFPVFVHLQWKFMLMGKGLRSSTFLMYIHYRFQALLRGNLIPMRAKGRGKGRGKNM